MAAYLTSGKVFMLSILTVSSVTAFYWLYWRRKKEQTKLGALKKSPTSQFVDKKLPITMDGYQTYTSDVGVKVLVNRLEDEDVANEEIRSILETLLKVTGFTQQHAHFLECGGISAAANKLKVTDDRIQELALLILNNMALNKESQKIIKNYIPQLSSILVHVIGSSDNLVLKSLQVFTNMSVLDDYHEDIVQQISYQQWSDLLNWKANTVIQVQTLKLLVNLSTNPSNIDILASSELLHPISRLTSPNVGHDLCLRSVTFLANILSTSQRLQKTSMKNFILSIPGLQENTRLLSRSEIEDIRFHANRALKFMI